MKILIGHNRYQWAGGEDAVVRTESRLLQEAGHQTQIFEADNQNVSEGFRGLFKARDLFWSSVSYDRLRATIRMFKPDVVHFHNIYFALTPSVYDACRDEGVAVVQSLHNFRMFCANALFFRDGHVCEDCLTKSPLEGIKNRCYRDSYLSSAAVSAVTGFHRAQKTWVNKVDRFITATEFTRQKYVSAGLPASKITVKPNVYIPNPDFVNPRGEYVLYVGRLSEEKGVHRLLEAWEALPNVPLKLMGDGPLSSQLKEFVLKKKMTQVEFLGTLDDAKYNYYMQGARFLVIPSQCYENFPRIAVEAFAFGLPVLASRLGSLAEIIVEGETGRLFDSLNSAALSSLAQRMWDEDLKGIATNVRRVFQEKYSPEVNLRQLLEIYEAI